MGFGAVRGLIVGIGLALSACHVGDATSQQTVHVVGSSTVFPFSAKVAQELKYKTNIGAIIESTGSGGGHKLFCNSPDANTPDITASSRRQKTSEYKRCRANGVQDYIELMVGFDGIVLAQAYEAQDMRLTTVDMFKAFARFIPQGPHDCRLQENPYTRWSDIASGLPNKTIEVYGPPPTSGTRDAFVENVMEAGAISYPCLAELLETDPPEFQRISHAIREDGHWIDSGENDSTLVQTLVNTPTSLGLLGYQFLDQNKDKIKGVAINGADPTFEAITNGAYPVSRSLYLYIKSERIRTNPAVRAFANEFMSEDAAGARGYLPNYGLIPLNPTQRQVMQIRLENLTPYEPL